MESLANNHPFLDGAIRVAFQTATYGHEHLRRLGRRQSSSPAIQQHSKSTSCTTAFGTLVLLVQFCAAYLQSALKLSWDTVTLPSALIVKCRVSCTRKLFPGPSPMILKLFTNVSFAWPF